MKETNEGPLCLSGSLCIEQLSILVSWELYLSGAMGWIPSTPKGKAMCAELENNIC